MKEDEKRDEVIKDFAKVINYHSLENSSDTPDFIIATYLVSCLENLNGLIEAREMWDEQAVAVERSEDEQAPINKAT